MSCSADWTIKLWDDRRTACVFSWDLNNAVVDVAWAPFSSTVFACVTANATVHVFDIAQNKLEPLCEQRVVRKSKLTRVCFNAKEPVILVGDDKGGVMALKLSPNLRQLTEVQSHRDKKTGQPLPVPTDKDELMKWQQEVCSIQAVAAATGITRSCTPSLHTCGPYFLDLPPLSNALRWMIASCRSWMRRWENCRKL